MTLGPLPWRELTETPSSQLSRENRNSRRKQKRRANLEVLEPKVVLAANVVAAYTVTQDWGTGFEGQIKLTNQQSTAVKNWSLAFDYGALITQIWDGKIVKPHRHALRRHRRRLEQHAGGQGHRVVRLHRHAVDKPDQPDQSHAKRATAERRIQSACASEYHHRRCHYERRQQQHKERHVHGCVIGPIHEHRYRELCHAQRHRDCWQRLHGGQRQADVQRRPNQQDDQRGDPGGFDLRAG